MEPEKTTHRYEIPRKASIGITGIIALSTVAGNASDRVRLACAAGILIVAMASLILQYIIERASK